MLRRWNNFWFSAVSPRRLALVRIVFFALLFVLAVRESIAAKLALFPASFWRPVSIIGVAGLPPSFATLRVLELVWCLALAASCVGFATRVSTIAASLTSLYLLGMLNSFGTVSHGRTPVALATIVLALAPCGDALSIDAWLRRKPSPVPSPRYGWPLQLLRVVWCLVFVSAGVSKLAKSGPAWVFSQNMASLLLLAPHRYPEAASASFAPGLGVWIGQHVVVCMALAFIALAFELGAPLALLGGGWTVASVTGMAFLQIGIYLVMFENFVWLLPLYAVWLPFERIMRGRVTLPVNR